MIAKQNLEVMYIKCRLRYRFKRFSFFCRLLGVIENSDSIISITNCKFLVSYFYFHNKIREEDSFHIIHNRRYVEVEFFYEENI